MSRTYRLRHEPSKISHKFGDANYTLHNDMVDGYWAGVIVHGIFGWPCGIIGDNIYRPNDMFSERACVFHHTLCICNLVDGWCVGKDITNKLAGYYRYSITSVHMHEYVRKYSKHRKSERKIVLGGIRTRTRRAIRAALKDGNFDEDWDTRLHRKAEPFGY